jgi:Glycosyltransferase family 9 (heptosyltransferase)
VVRSVVTSGAKRRRDGGRDEMCVTGAVGKNPHRVTDLGGRLTLPHLATALAGVHAVVRGNTGPMHLAAALGTPVVADFAATVPVGPLGAVEGAVRRAGRSGVASPAAAAGGVRLTSRCA